MLDRGNYFIRQHIGMFKLTEAYDILDPETQQQIGIAKEEPADWAKYLRLIVNKKMLPTTVRFYENEGSKHLFSIEKPFTFLASKVMVLDGMGRAMGSLQGKLFTLGGGFWVYDPQGNQIAEVKGDWKGWDFRFYNNVNEEMGSITKKWAGIGKELFTSADNYMVTLADEVKGNKEMSALLLAAALAIDIVYKEHE